MEDRRRETAPVWLILLATAALGTSGVIVGFAPAPKEAAEIDQPARTAGPLRWRIAELPALATPKLPAAGRYLTQDATRVRVTPPAMVPVAGEITSFGPSELDLLALAPVELRDEKPTDAARQNAETAPAPSRAVAVVRFRPSVVVLVPSQPAWKAGDSAAMVLSQPLRQRWSIGGVDTLASARRAGRAITGGELTALGTRVGEALARLALTDTPKVATVEPKVAKATAKLLAPRAYRVVPIEVTPVRSVKPLSIAAYLSRGGAPGAFPTPPALAEQLDRVAASRSAAPWAWAVAYRLRTLSGSPTSDPQSRRALAALEAAAQEAFQLAAQAGTEAAATELRRAGYGLTRRLATWTAEQTQVLALLERRQPAAERLEQERWAMASGPSFGRLMRDRRETRPVLRVAQRIEEYEQKPTSLLARTLAADAARLASIGDAEGAALATAINQNYRNANVRVAIGADLIRRLLPQPEPIVAPVRDRIAGTPVSGRSTTETQLGVRLVPDANAWRIGLEAEGVVTSRTYSRGGPAVLGAQGSTEFSAKKLLLLTPVGMQAAPTIASAQVRSQRLTSLRTDYDRVPLLGKYVRSTAKEEYGRMRHRAQAETRVKVERQVRQTLDQRITPQLAEIEARFASEVTDRFANLGLTIEPIEMRSTDLRLITRVRLANESQLAAHTPRMRAPSDSLLSLQMHESTLNNALDGLELAGQTLTTDSLRERLVERLRLPASTQSGGEQATFRFAAEEPIRFRLADGRVELTLAFQAIAVRGKQHRNFKVHAFYRPEVNGLVAELVQDGTPQIEGRMRNASRMHLHGVMGKVFSAGQRVPLVRVNDDTPERLSRALVGLATNQFVIEDGWLGLAIGPPRPAATRTALQVGGYVR